MKVAYTPYSQNMTEPGDRRRLVSYLNRKDGFQLVPAVHGEEYDIVYTNIAADLPYWIAQKKQSDRPFKLVFELIDSYLSEQKSFSSMLRGIGKFATGKSSQFYLDFRKCLIEMCSIADAVVCSTEEQKKTILQYNKNIHVILDFFEDDIDSSSKAEKTISQDIGKSNSSKITLVWEGLPYTLENILSISSSLQKLRDEVELKIVTDLEFYRFNKRFFKQKTEKIVENLGIDFKILPWEKSSFADNIQSSDIAIIPINPGNQFHMGKPENKLVLLWKLGVPALVSPTPAYRRAMDRLGEDMTCTSESDWEDKILRYGKLRDEEKQRLLSKISSTIDENYSLGSLVSKWDRLFESLN